MVLFFFILLLIFGTKVAAEMDIDVFPDLTAPTVVVMTDCHAMSPEEVERLLSFPIEVAVNGAASVRRVRSSSAQGYSFVWVEFNWGTNVQKARQIVSEKLAAVRSQLPQGVAQPILAPQSSVMGEILFLSIKADSTSMMQVRTLADWTIKPLILATNGVSQVTNIGGDYKQYQVLANPQKMAYYNISMLELEQTCRTLSQNSTGGVIREFGNEYLLRGIGRTNVLSVMESTFVKHIDGKPVRIGDVARVQIGAAPKMGYASHDASPAVIMSISKQPDANTLVVTKEIEVRLAALQASLPADVQIDTHIFRQADFIEAAINNVLKALLEGAILVTLILFLFLGNTRTTFISLLAIPLSLLGSVLVLKLLGMNINTMSLGGMVIAIGSLVDDAIIDVENVYKRLRQNYALPKKQRASSFKVVYTASCEIRSSIFNATIIIMIAFLPLFFLSGMEGRMLRPLGISFLVSLLVSLFVAMTLTPLLSKLLLSGDKFLAKQKEGNNFSKFLARFYERSLNFSFRYNKTVLVSISILFVFSLFIFSGFGRSLLPEFNEGSLVVSVVTPPGTSLDENNRLGKSIEQEMLKIPEIIATTRRTGRGELDEHAQATHSAEIDLPFQLHDRTKEEFLSEVRSRLAIFPGISVTIGQPLGHRIDHMISGTRANIAIKIFGDDLDQLYTIGNNIKESIDGIEGLVDIQVQQQVEVPQLQIIPNREVLAQYGISLEYFNNYINTGFGSEKIADIYEGQKKFDLTLRLDSTYTTHISRVGDALLSTSNGQKIPMGQLAEIKSVVGPSTISRENVQRTLVVSANVSGGDLRGVVTQIQSAVNAKVSLDEGYRVEYGGQFESEAKASKQLLFTSIAALFIIFFLLYNEFSDVKLAGMVLLSLPFSIIGGIFALYFGSGVLSIPATIGFISLSGIAVRNGILLVSNYQRLEKQGCPLEERIRKGSIDRLNAILMTASTGALALVPMAINGHQAGNEIQSPMAIVILGGMLSSTFLNLYIMPLVYQILQPKSVGT